MLALAFSLSACFDACFYDGPTRGLEVAGAGENAEGTASFTTTAFSFALRYHGLEVDGVPRTGFISAFRRPENDPESGEPTGLNSRLVGQVMSMQGYFAERYPDWLCRVIELRVLRAGGTQEVCLVAEPEQAGAPCVEPMFVDVALEVLGHAEIFSRELPDPDVYVSSDGCGDEP